MPDPDETTKAGRARWINHDFDSRRSRPGSPTDDATQPLSRVRTVVVKRQKPLSAPEPSTEPELIIPETVKPPAEARPSRRVSWWWWAGGGVALLAGLAFALLLLLKDPGFVLIVRGAPPGSDVYIDNVRRGVTRADGTIKVLGLESGKRLIRVSHEGFADFNTGVTGKDGETKSVIAELAALEAKAEAVTEIDYNGPMILIPAGEFIMGDDNHQPNEKPAHKVALAGFYIDKYEVTNAQYKKFCEETGRALPTNPFWDSQYFVSNPNSPVVGVNWHDAASYARWAGKRLPAEAEWEKAASWGPDAQRKRQWPWGEAPDSNRVVLGASRPPPIGNQTGSESGYGVCDMAGGVAEWVESFYQPYASNQTSDPNYGTKNRVVRGGHFRSEIDDVRTTARYYNPPEFTPVEKKERTWLIGFRCAVSADDPRVQEFLRARGR